MFTTEQERYIQHRMKQYRGLKLDEGMAWLAVDATLKNRLADIEGATLHTFDLLNAEAARRVGLEKLSR